MISKAPAEHQGHEIIPKVGQAHLECVQIQGWYEPRKGKQMDEEGV